MRVLMLAMCSVVGFSGLPAAQEPTTTAQLSVRVRARICDAEGRPLPGAGMLIGDEAQLTTSAALASPQARTGEDGALDFTTTLGRGSFEWPILLIAAPGKVAYRSSLFLANDEKSAQLLDLGEVRLPNGHTLSGRVRDQNGKPVAGARIRAVDNLSPTFSYSSSFSSYAATNEKGVFLLPGVFSSAIAITVTADGYYQRQYAWVDLGSPLDVRLETSGYFEGTVVDADGKPFAGTIQVSHEFWNPTFRTYRIEQGKFRLPVHQPGRCRLTFYTQKQVYAGQSEVLAGPAKELTIRVEAPKGQSFIVQAVEAGNGQPLAAIRAAAMWTPYEISSYQHDQLRRSLQPSEHDGTVKLTADSQDANTKCSVYVEADGFAPQLQTDVPWADVKFVAQLAREARIEGRIVDADTHAPLAGAKLTLTGRLAAKKKRGREPVPQVLETTTAADGTFQLRGITAGPCTLVAKRPDSTATVSRTWTVKAGEVVADVSIEMPKGVAVTGKFTGPSAAAGWRVRMVKPRANDEPEMSAFRLGLQDLAQAPDSAPIVDNQFRFERRAAGKEELRLLVPIPPRHGSALEIDISRVEIDEQDTAVELDLAKYLPSAIEGSVAVVGAEMPLGRLAVVATQNRKQNAGHLSFEEQLLCRHWALVGENGRFSIPVVPGKHTIEVVDVATGVVMLTVEDSVDATAGQPVAKNLRVEAVLAQVMLQWEDPKQPSSQRVEVLVGNRQRYDGSITLFGGGVLGTPGFDLSTDERCLPLFVPPGDVRLAAYRGATRIDRGAIEFGGDEVVAKATFVAELGTPAKVTLELPLPKPLPDR